MKKRENARNFRITQGKGFGITFANGWGISVQFGAGNYCDHYNGTISTEAFREQGEQGSDTAECAVFDPAGNFVHNKRIGMEHGVSNRSTPEEVARLIAWVVKQQSSQGSGQ